MQQLIDDLPEQVALVSEDFTIVAVNSAWTQAMKSFGYARMAPGDNYRESCEKVAASGWEPSVKALAALDEIAAGKRIFWQLSFHGRDRWSDREYQLCYHRVVVGSQAFITVRRFDLTEIAELRRLRDDFSKSVIETQTIERRRMARELHDSTAQLLAAVGLLLGNLKRQSPRGDSVTLVEEIQELIGEAQTEIRSISYLAHPPALEKLGLVGALKSLVEGFGNRSGLEVSFGIEGEIAPVSVGTEGAIYRIGQEGLSNVYRHARAAHAHVTLCFRRSMVHLIIADDGVGISKETLAAEGRAGIGLVSMRMRLLELGGRLSVRRLSRGTAIIASVDLERSRAQLVGEAEVLNGLKI